MEDAEIYGVSYSDDLWDEKVEPGQKINGKKHHKMFHFLTNQVVQNYSPVMAVVGKEGKGKSMAALEISRILHEVINLMEGPFDPMTNLCYDVIEFLDVIKSQSRQVVMFDEAGVNLNSRQWHSDFNRAIDETIQTMRFKSNIYIFVLPKLKDLDKRVRERIDLRVEMEKPGVGKVTLYEYDFGQIESGGSERKTYHMNTPLVLDKPPEEHKSKYREKEAAFKRENVENWIEELVSQKREEEEDEVSPLREALQGIDLDQ